MAKKPNIKRCLKADEPDQPTVGGLERVPDPVSDGRERAPGIRIKILVPAAPVSAKSPASCTFKNMVKQETIEPVATESCNRYKIDPVLSDNAKSRGDCTRRAEAIVPRFRWAW